jgi:hypothetical protein
MNNWDPLETQLRSWTPRRPSPKITARLFETPVPVAVGVAAATRESNPTTWQWLAPAMAVFLVSAFVLGGNFGRLSEFNSTPAPSLVATAALNEPHLSTYFAFTHHSDNNTLQAPFEWTNSGSSVTTAPSMATTNALMQ